MTEPETVASSRIFISYRREDSSGHVLALMPPLRERFGTERIVKDTDNIAPGQDFVKVIESQLQSCAVLLAIIGKDWVSVQDPKLKVRRLDNPTDFLRVEVATALKNEHVLVIPVLVGKASMPTSEELPPDLEPLARRHALELSDIRWDSDVDRLIRAIEHACGESSLVRPAGAPGPTASPPATLQPDEAAAKRSDVDQGETFDLFEDRRDREIAHHVGVAREALEAQDLEAVLEACKKAIWLDPQEPEARTLVRRAQTALNERKITEWLVLAQESLEQIAEAPLGRTANEGLASAAELIDQALVLDPDHKTAVNLRQELLRLRKKREQQRDIERHVQGALASARASLLDEDDFDSAVDGSGALEGSTKAEFAEEVDCTVFAPVQGWPGDSFLVQVFAHLPEQATALEQVAKGADPDTAKRVGTTLPKEITRGSKLVFNLTMPGLEIDEPSQSCIWKGKPAIVQFGVTVPMDSRPRAMYGTVIVCESSVPIGHLKFKFEIVSDAAAAGSSAQSNQGVAAGNLVRYKRAFISYASADRPEVLKRVQMLNAMKVTFFQDLLTLEPGDQWEKLICQYIDESDVCYLFWSTAASESVWVRKEIEYANNRKAGNIEAAPEIVPIIIEGPPPAKPPAELNFLHFNDKFIYFINSKEADG